MTTISAKTILRSRNASAPDKVLSTLLLRYPRWIHAEQRTHRVIPLDEGLEFEAPTPSVMADPALSRNAASSRAIPVKKIIDDILADTAMPLHWGAAQSGMQADQECNAAVEVDAAHLGTEFVSRESAWIRARNNAIEIARAYEAAGYHKQVINRLLEPFMHITVLVSATEWDNFLELRDHKDAEPHMQMLAREIRKCLDEDPVQELHPDDWHLPFIEKDDRRVIGNRHLGAPDHAYHAACMDDAIKLSVARCASTSFKTTDGFEMTLERATAIYDKLFSKPFHASPFEHVAQADKWIPEGFSEHGWLTFWEHGNFEGFRQLRKQLEHAV